MRKARFICTIAWVAATAALAAAPVALADTGSSSNWSGYAIHRQGVSFASVSASWTQPHARCRRGQRRFSAMWVGLGGFAVTSQALEQIGTEVDCVRGGRIASSAWFELVPQASRPIHMRVRPGDQMAATVSVIGHTVSLSLVDATSHATFQRTLTASLIDVTSAEWILEAPSECVSATSCQTLPLANFGSAGFSSAHALATTGHTGTISDPAWDNTEIRLRPSGRRFVIYHGSGATAGGALPSPLTPDGSAFTVSFAHVRVFGKLASVRHGRLRPYVVH